MTVVNRIDGRTASLLLEASIQAYNAYDPKRPAHCDLDWVKSQVQPPKGWEVAGSWSGVDDYFGDFEHQVECFGVVFRTLDPPYRYLFSFRGTYSLLDALEDVSIFEEKKPFVPRGSRVPPSSKALVAAGFWSVYTASTPRSSSMQDQLFRLLRRFQVSHKPPSEILVTGHSLGAALSELFTLDLALSGESLPTQNMNFACPRVGNKTFADLYDSQEPQQHQVTRTVRVQNTYDIVPCGPPEGWPFSYRHVGDAFLLAFYNQEAGWLDPKAKYYDHQALNYQAVLECALETADQVCEKDDLKVPADCETLRSLKPDPSTLCDFFAEEGAVWVVAPEK